MRCRLYNVSMVGGPHHSSFISQRRLCVTDETLLAWIIAHLFINLFALRQKERRLTRYLTSETTTVMHCGLSSSLICSMMAEYYFSLKPGSPCYVYQVLTTGNPVCMRKIWSLYRSCSSKRQQIKLDSESHV
ncbi:unnamed protein product [Angiostrongylus costaricensis]|uniref:Uncharacterized protein n=1 Tax=Angiostrongylus costaricensis TaxID=334426 RepID=A0A0R3Q0P0_ANGCS|nr:unnamed protein product [Angiostrongylus costaricensis]